MIEYSLQHPPFPTFGQWHAWYLGVDLAPFQPDAFADQGSLAQALPDYFRFYQALLEDLYTNPTAYGVPEIPYVSALAADASAEELARIRESILKVRKAIGACTLDFLLKAGQMAELDGEALVIDRARYNQLLTEKAKRMKSMAFLRAYERTGLSIEPGIETVRISNNRFPGMPAALGAFARACATIPDDAYFFFRRCDFEVLTGKRLPAFNDALRWVSPVLSTQVVATDALLSRLKFKREILASEVGGGYRVRYQRRSAVYWCRIQTQFNPPLIHNVRWDLQSDTTPRLFARLEAGDPALALRVFMGIKRCKRCYEECMARAQISYQGQTVDVCNEDGWNGVGITEHDFEDVRRVLEELAGVI